MEKAIPRKWKLKESRVAKLISDNANTKQSSG
jgi:hypothetical protein